MGASLEKLKIIAYSSADCKESERVDVPEYTVLINPDQVVMDTKIKYKTPEKAGTSGDQKVFEGIESPKFNIKLIFDGTGVLQAAQQFSPKGVASSLLGKNKDKPSLGTVEEQLDAFRKVANYYNGTEHEPNYVKIAWGGVLFKGRLETFKVTYSLFSPDGKPLRATGDAGFIGSIDPDTDSKRRNANSPDLTHIRTVMEGDTLPLMCEKIYKDSTRYLEVARVNKLSNCRKLKPGMKLFFPPIKAKQA